MELIVPIFVILYVIFAFRSSWKGKLYLKNPHNHHLREAPVGFSWTVLFFGFIPPLFRKDWLGAVIILVIAFFTFGLSNLVFGFIYNKMYLKGLIKDGFKVKSTDRDIEFISRTVSMELPMLNENDE
ncbi:MAG: hypothetical protein OXH47_04025 [Paracoccaceae bacterium]|nr:hypothetical protein [Paracoccaceae bacterium]